MDHQEQTQLRAELESMYRWMSRVKFYNPADELKAARYSHSLRDAINMLPEEHAETPQ